MLPYSILLYIVRCSIVSVYYIPRILHLYILNVCFWGMLLFVFRFSIYYSRSVIHSAVEKYELLDKKCTCNGLDKKIHTDSKYDYNTTAATSTRNGFFSIESWAKSLGEVVVKFT